MKKDKEAILESHVFVVQGLNVKSNVERKFKKNKLFCSQCRKNVHDVTTCVKVHGVPDWKLEKFRGNKIMKKGGSNNGGTVSGFGGGINNNGTVGNFGGVSAHVKLTGETPNNANLRSIVGHGTQGLGGGTKLNDPTTEQMQRLLKLVNEVP